MKKTMAMLMAVASAGAMSASAAIIAGIDNWDSVSAPTVPVTAANITATATASASVGGWSIADSGTDPGRGSSDDTTWGTYSGDATPADATSNVGPANFTLTNAKPDGEITLTIVNNGLTDITLGMFHFDALALRPKAARTWAVNVLAGSDITVGNVYTSGLPQNDNSTDAITHVGGALSGHDQHDDIDLSLAGLADNVLEAGGTAIFQLAFSNGVGDNAGGHHLFVDNVAVSTIPEPATMGLMAIFGGGVMFFRRRFMV